MREPVLRVAVRDLLSQTIIRGPSPSMITLNPAIRDQVKTGHRDWPKT
jgi:hypothetical protein